MKLISFAVKKEKKNKNKKNEMFLFADWLTLIDCNDSIWNKHDREQKKKKYETNDKTKKKFMLS